VATFHNIFTHLASFSLFKTLIPLATLFKKNAYFGIFRRCAAAFDLMSSVVKKGAFWGPFQSMNRQKSLVTRSEECDGWVMPGIFFSARNCCTTSGVWLIVLLRSRIYCPCLSLVTCHLSLVTPPPLNCIAQPLQTLSAEATSIITSNINSSCTKPSV
jgi:hypothetical protein